MSDDSITIEVDGRPVVTRRGAMIIEATDTDGTYIPRFCYHKHLSIAANCRMCLVEVEKVPKPVPACATPVADGMKIYTRSKLAIDAQKSTMEFLLINHPLDCPICDQGGECELQDLAMGYGGSVSQYSEGKRVVRDKDIGPLVQTEMTRCIHCTRCVRFGEEIAGMRELGATGRGEFVEIGTYIEKAMKSELSGNVIDLCPVGALTSRPYRYTARAWELQQRDGIAPHDCFGSNVHFHSQGPRLKRVIPKEKELVNETWLSDRDRFSYEGLMSDARLLRPRIKRDGQWDECDWEVALEEVRKLLRSTSGDKLGALASPSSTTEELFLLQRLLRELGSSNVDSRLWQLDFRGQDDEPRMPALGSDLADVEHADAVFLVGAYPRHEQPLLNHRIRKAALWDAKVMQLTSAAYDLNFDPKQTLVAAPTALVGELGAIVAAALEVNAEADVAPEVRSAVQGLAVSDAARKVAQTLVDADEPLILTGGAAERHAHRAILTMLTAALAAATGARCGNLSAGANAAGGWLAGAVPHRGPGGRPVIPAGLDALSMCAAGLDTLLLLGFDPAMDTAAPAAYLEAARKAANVVAVTAFTSPALDEVSTIQLPMACYAENEGSFVNLTGSWQSFAAAIKAPGAARPAWKILRVMGAALECDGFDAVDVTDLTRELQALCGDDLSAGDRAVEPDTAAVFELPAASDDCEIFLDVPMYGCDALVRHAPALQATDDCGSENVAVHPVTLEALGLESGEAVTLTVDGATVECTVEADERLAPKTVRVFSTSAAARAIGGAGTARLKRAAKVA